MKYFIENEPTSPVNYRYPVERVLYRGRSRYQQILVFDSPFHGRVMALDHIVQLTTREEHFYHEMLVHPILQAHPDPRHVLIIGGGDGGTLREIVKYPAIEEVVECELDEKVVEVARKFFPRVASGYRDPRAKVLFADGMKYLRETDKRFDAIILDLTDPIGPAKPLFEKPFYRLCAEHLTPNGFLCAQTESLQFHARTVRNVHRALASVFPTVAVASIPLAMYPGNWWTFSVGSQSLDPREARNSFTPSTRIYSRPDHNWFFVPEDLLVRLMGPAARRGRVITKL
ncbi:MAG: polyamine aminopropyltransferase [Anaerolineae bacterium]